jgi:hypothetical protein
MLRIALVLAVLLAAAAAVVLLLAARKPDTFRVERSILVGAAPPAVHALIADFRRWRGWSPWEDVDPALQRSYSGSEQGVGAVYAWSGNGKAGQGRMEILASDPARGVRIQLDFSKPFEAHNTADFALQPEAGGTRLTWAMEGPSPLMSKVMQVFVSMDGLVGKDFERGLQRLKTLAEQPVPGLTAPS